MDERDLLRALRDGNTELAPLAVSVFGKDLASYIYRAYPWISQADQEAVCEAALERAVAKIALYDESRGSFPAWVRGFIRHEVGDRIRRGSLPHHRLPPDEQFEARAPTPLSEELSDAEAAVRAALSGLTVSDQTILALRTVEGLDYASISGELGIDEAACRQRHRRALIRLKNAISQQAEAADAPPRESTTKGADL